MPDDDEEDDTAPPPDVDEAELLVLEAALPPTPPPLAPSTSTDSPQAIGSATAAETAIAKKSGRGSVIGERSDSIRIRDVLRALAASPSKAPSPRPRNLDKPTRAHRADASRCYGSPSATDRWLARNGDQRDAEAEQVFHW